MDQRPKVGLGVAVIKDGKVLLGKRKNAHGDGAWCFPGGHLEFGESWEQCAVREVQEETGLKIRDLEFAGATNDIYEKEGKHYVTIIIQAQYASGEVQVREPEKCEQWGWFDWEALPQPLFLSTENYIKHRDTNL